MLTRAEYDRYAAAFAARDYDFVFSHFHDDAMLEFAGYRLNGVPLMRAFYDFFHAHVDERLEILGFVSSDALVMVDGIIHLHFRKAIAPEALAERGLERLASMEPGQSVAMPQFIAYDIADGKFVRARCAVLDTVTQQFGPE